MNDLTVEQFVENVEFDTLAGIADVLGVSCGDYEMWLDDEWPDREDALRVEVCKAMEQAGKVK